MYIYKHTRIHTCICMLTHMHIHMHVYIFLCDYVSESTLTARGPRKLSDIKNFKFVIKIGPHTDVHTYMYACMHTRTCNARLIAKSNQGLRAGNNNNSNKQCDCSRLLSTAVSPQIFAHCFVTSISKNTHTQTHAYGVKCFCIVVVSLIPN